MRTLGNENSVWSEEMDKARTRSASERHVPGGEHEYVDLALTPLDLRTNIVDVLDETDVDLDEVAHSFWIDTSKILDDSVCLFRISMQWLGLKAGREEGQVQEK